MPDRLLYRVEEVAEMLAIGRSKTYELIAAGELPVVRLGRYVRVPADALQHWLAAQGQSEWQSSWQEAERSAPRSW
ncbi:MAG: helix-turn-helix domain-containing protein [Chloroflexi bacterium]|nr:helix-turn-helix domain-containing protein [Chloroflexota bacterium]